MKQDTLRLMLVDDHFVVRAGLAGSLSIEPDIEIVAECGTGEDAVAVVEEARPDVILLDWRLPGMDGPETAVQLLAKVPQARIISLTVFEGEEDIYMAVEAGVSSYLPKSVDRSELLAAIRAVHAGGTAFPEEIQRKLELRRSRPGLTDREREVLRCIVLGRSNKEIASDLGVSEVTVKFHVTHLLEKLGVQDRTQATAAAYERGMIHPE